MSSFGAIQITFWVVLLALLYGSGRNKATDAESCSRWCGNHNISHPFRLKDSPQWCGDTRYNLSCEANHLVLYLGDGKYYVRSINYNNYTMLLVDANLGQHDYSFSRYSSSNFNFKNYSSPYQIYRHRLITAMLLHFPYKEKLAKGMLYVRCPNSSDMLYVDGNIAMNCMKSSYVFGSTRTFYVNVDGISLWDLALGDSCRVEYMYMTSWPDEISHRNISCSRIHQMLLYGFEVSWMNSLCSVTDITLYREGMIDGNSQSPRCQSPGLLANDSSLIFGPILYLALFCCAKCVLGTPCLLVLCTYKWRRRHLSMYHAIEDFLRSDNNIMPIRYSYRDIKRITEQFKTKLGNGGYGSVFKGQLRSGRFVAVKILDKAKANGQEFINEVATIGRIHHVNVVQLIGFCVEGSKRALIYEFMPNGSLEKYIFSHEHTSSLSCKNLYAIALGVARGIEYLHNGCNMKILHFDIKPHNILLDENFNPKVSDFGLARLCPTDNSIVSLTAARGTIGYMAPELFYRNVGTVSYKADVYSFGMLLMEMAGRRKNLNALAEQSSQIYFPFWIYDQLHDGREIIIENDMEEEDMNLAKKMMIVALWCIQTKPSDRPPMDKVLEMLEEDNELQIPSKPYLYPRDLPAEDVRDYSSSRASSDISVSDSKKSI